MRAAPAAAAGNAGRSRLVRDLALTAALLAALGLWDFSGADAALTRWFGNPQGFAWRNHFITSTLVHDGGRMVAWVVLLSLLVGALRAPQRVAGAGLVNVPQTAAPATTTPSRRERLYWWVVTLLCLLLVPVIKRYSATSCPWELAEFGGLAHSVSHWQWGVSDGGPGHCFPSGHAVAAFAFLSQYFLWRPHHPQRARAWLMLVLAAGFIFGLGQLARGAHHASHSAWTAALCWVVCVAASAWKDRHRG